ncbi:heterokaryon incompatibility protein-domain-containing protein [Clohesyomyces aquaticus]|uniref:Heterokaryon incompatibility protein-domain-containing protein n=1 Tax=Clohesyomyces aquaticus TaxID=1231657 RepID=A0A1Y2A1Q3_9PLEO|nr:heterokaryon incompatibility protein-domain-containing protein [Clohesyomyces aquaticus]
MLPNPELRSPTAIPFASPWEDEDTRLLILAPGTRNDPLKGFLTPVSRVNDATECIFEQKHVAPSYTWGDQSDPTMLKLNSGYTMQVCRNLASALVHAGLKDINFCVLWVDALWVDQKDDVEKASQVQIMATIYEAAAFTPIWLGDASMRLMVWGKRLNG